MRPRLYSTATPWLICATSKRASEGRSAGHPSLAHQALMGGDFSCRTNCSPALRNNGCVTSGTSTAAVQTDPNRSRVGRVKPGAHQPQEFSKKYAQSPGGATSVSTGSFAVAPPGLDRVGSAFLGADAPSSIRSSLRDCRNAQLLNAQARASRSIKAKPSLARLEVALFEA